MIDKKTKLIKLFENWAEEKHIKFYPLSPSGSYREYYRIKSKSKNAIGVFNNDKKENIAFIKFTKHFLKKGLNVPKIYRKDLRNNIYLEEDLGDTTLFAYLTAIRKNGDFPSELIEVYKHTLVELPKFQIQAGKDIDYSVCYPRNKFDKQSMMWDLNYFKYYFLKLAKIPFEEQALENDFQIFTDYLLETDTDYFLYRDFQSRNIMLLNNKPFFIDYQGGRKGALQYDLASLLFDAKADIPYFVREELLNFYISKVKEYVEINETKFKQYFFGYVLIRIMQAMGAYGFRGFYEKKEHFLKSIPFAIDNLEWLLNNVTFPEKLKGLLNVLEKLTNSKTLRKFNVKKNIYKLNVTITSFSYKKGIPQDNTGNGGGFVFDCRAVFNPGRFDKYKLLTGKDPEVIKFLQNKSKANKFLSSVYKLVDQSVEVYQKGKFSHLMVNFGCTGGQHRSVYCAEKLASHLSEHFDLNIKILHTELG